MQPGVDIFCRVVDNYGDIGVCWRLARRLAHDKGWAVRMWVDDLHSFRTLEPAIDPTHARQALLGITVEKWRDQHDACDADIVIEAFACDPPPSYIAAMRRKPIAPVWINLEYLSAERWVQDCHGLSSLRADGLKKTFFFPGFTPGTGGLTREPGLLAERDAIQASRQTRIRALAALGLAPLAERMTHPDHRLVTLFCYPHAPLADLVHALADRYGSQLTLAAAESVAPTLETVASGHDITIMRMPFLRQPEFDRLLWCADLNIVRGEDSFLRAIWAARPMIWHIYPQPDQAHLAKLDAWLQTTGLPEPVVQAHRLFNAADVPVKGEATPVARVPGLSMALAQCLSPTGWPDWEQSTRDDADRLAAMSDLADNVADFCMAALNSR